MSFSATSGYNCDLMSSLDELFRKREGNSFQAAGARGEAADHLTNLNRETPPIRMYLQKLGTDQTRNLLPLLCKLRLVFEDVA